MLFNDPIFLFLFLPGSVILCWASKYFVGYHAALISIIAASLLFYGWWNPVYLLLLAAVTVFTFGMGKSILASRARGRLGQARILLIIGVSANVSVLGFFKYTDFLIGSANSLTDSALPLQHIVLPLGISFFTFQKIAYLVDASRGEVKDHGFLEYCFFVMFFPQLIAGPIVHHSEIFGQIHRPRTFSFSHSNLIIGLTIFVFGLFKKVVLADNFAPIASATFGAAAAHEQLHFFQAWQGALAYAFQLYFDFSGYTDMAIGAARMFGIKLPLNFNSPYQATSIIDFWRRWHMTLSRFLRDYVYFSFGGGRRGRFRRYVNLLLTMVIGGLWHGAAWTFVLWGFIHGVLLIVNHAWRSVWTPRERWWSRAIARALTFLVVVLAWVPFRATSMDAAVEVYRGMVNLPYTWESKLGPLASALKSLGVRFEGPFVHPDDMSMLLVLLLFVLIVWILPNTQQFMARFYPAFGYALRNRLQEHLAIRGLAIPRALTCWRPSFAAAVYVGLLGVAALLSLQRVSEFIYFQF